MIPAEAFCDELRTRGYTLATGVPCSHFGGPIALLSRTPGRYVPAANEGGALALAAGATLAGQRAYVMLQNSGLGNLINPLTSLLMTFHIPVLTFVSQRGCPDPADDEPQHQIMGPATAPILDAIGVPRWDLHKGHDTPAFQTILDQADKALASRQPAFVLVEKGAVGKAAPGPAAAPRDGLSSGEAIRLIATVAPHAAIIATTGYTGRELFGLADTPGNFYMQGSMGHAPSIALGVALTRPERPVVVIDGDGAALMHLGALSVIGDQAPPNLTHVILDNGAHESTGAQRTTSATTSLTAAAQACGYRTTAHCDTLADLDEQLRRALRDPGPHALTVRTRLREGAVPPRATNTFSADALRDRFTASFQAR